MKILFVLLICVTYAYSLRNIRRLSPVFTRQSALIVNRAPVSKPRPVFLASNIVEGCEENCSRKENLSILGDRNPMKLLYISVLASAGVTAVYHSAAFINSQAFNIRDSGFVKSFLVIFASEIGDKTFWIAALLAAKFGKLVTFLGVMAAVVSMGLVASLAGLAFRSVPPIRLFGIPIEEILTLVAFSVFGIKSFTEVDWRKPSTSTACSVDADTETKVPSLEVSNLVIFWQVFYLILSAEFGDRSFLSTLTMATTSNPAAVMAGSIAAHASATAIAIASGSLLASLLSEKAVSLMGGSAFLLCAALSMNRIRNLLRNVQ